MKTLMSIILSAIILGSNITAQELTVKEIIDKIDKNERLQSSVGKSKQIITTSSGKIRTLEMISYSKDNNDKQLTEYTSPSRVAGDKILMLEDGNEIWFYTPKTDRVRHLASHAKKQKVQGSDFSYEDMCGWEYHKDFTYKLLGSEKIDGNITYKLELIPTKTGPHYSKMIVWAHTSKFAILQADYYKDGDLLKRLITSDITKFGDHWIAKKMKMQNLQDGGETVIETISLDVNTQVDNKLFNTNYLKRN